MNTKLASLFHLLITATMISATAGCATVQTVFAPGIVAQAKSAGSEAIAADGAALVPGSVDLSISKNGSEAAYSGALIPGSVDLAIFSNGSETAHSGALVPGSVDLSISRNRSETAYSGALVPGSVDLAISRTGSGSAYNGALVPGSVDLLRTPATVSLAMPYLSRFRR
jgi:hypothetical protein